MNKLVVWKYQSSLPRIILIAVWLDEQAFEYYRRMDFEMFKKLLLTAINCAKRLLKGQNELEINDIEDDHLRDEI